MRMTSRSNPNASSSPAALLRGATGGARRAWLGPALTGERFALDDISCYVAGTGPPMLLVHSVNAVPSAAEVRPLFDHYRATHTVFAPDLPGFGFSTRRDRAYTPRLMTDALHAIGARIRERCGKVPIDALAVSLGCEFLARAAVEQPALWGRISLVSPTGLSGTTPRRGALGSVRTVPGLHALLSVPLWTRPLYRALTKPPIVRYFLERTWGNKAIDESLWAYDVLTAQQEGARYAPLCFLAGSLFSGDIHQVYESLTQPVWMSRGTRGDFTDFRAHGLLHTGTPWRQTVFETGALPYFERPGAFFTAFDAFRAETGGP